MNCYECERKHECYTDLGLSKLTPDTNYGMYDCGALYNDFDGARTLLLRIGEALDTLPKKHREAVIRHIAKAYQVDHYAVLSELYG